MKPDPRFDILFEPVKIGVVTAPIRFSTVPLTAGLHRREMRPLLA